MAVLTITRPANTTQYGQGDVIASSTTAATASGDLPYVELARPSLLHSIQLSKPNNNVTNASFRCWVLDAAPTLTNGDNGALAGIVLANVVGVFACTFAAGDVYFSQTLMDMHDTMGLKTIVGASGAEVGFTPRSVALEPGRYYFVLEATAAYTPASGEVFSIRPNLEPCV